MLLRLKRIHQRLVCGWCRRIEGVALRSSSNIAQTISYLEVQ
nr:MAG TPA: Sine oculis-binding protein [Caudoviricetes sp.]